MADKQLRTIVRQINISRCDGWMSVPRVLVVLNPVLERLRAGVVCPEGWSVVPQGRDLCPRGALRSVEFGGEPLRWQDTINNNGKGQATPTSGHWGLTAGVER